MTTIIQSIEECKLLCRSFLTINKKIGFVPTMGALHQGHETLFKRSVSENDVTIASIFVNPTQFNDPKDLENYPKTFYKDLEILNNNSVEYLFYPEYQDLYPDGYTFRVSKNKFSKILCGSFRPNHFDGVLTVVLKLLNVILPHRAYFGEKNYQQLKLIEQMCKAFFLDVERIACPTIRDYDGLALSSRNILLTMDERKQFIFQNY
ncbi:pantoate--beta-alanine ligase [Stygiobacter electus]|uniref:Pantoate--beta-alanine ligase n=1 Tax=Stygiobacter electus TaxID=3032292 RepID=A0AAE3P0K9_9BACT|nr:pantoate--beta-alanine ligase [Stygiobacter electus]MDF1612194.1 pantoate--beta-alanine ligase [Stygiobacter electus]